jgi:hypothetical protein
MRNVHTALALFFCVYQTSAQAQPAANPARNQVIGQATSVDGSARRIVLRDDRGSTVAVSAEENTPVLRIPPGETDIKKAAKIAFTEIGAGDRILAVGALSADGKELQARTLVVMSKSDIAQKQQRELQEWQTRGIAGTVSSIDAGTKALTVKAGQKLITVDTAAAVEFRRYAPDSVKFSDSVPGSFSDIKTGDQIRAMGDKSADGLSLKAERVVSGSFRQIAGIISSVRADAGEIRINDLVSKKPVTVLVNSASVMKKLSPVAAATLARRFRPAEGGAPAGGGPPVGRGPGAGGEIGQLLDRLPAVPLSDLKPGDAIMISGSAGNDAGHLTAITLLAGVEPLLTASPSAARDIMAGWNFGEGNAPE